MTNINWDREKAIKYCSLASSAGQQARGYLDGLLGREPNPNPDARTNDYMHGYNQGKNDRMKG